MLVPDEHRNGHIGQAGEARDLIGRALVDDVPMGADLEVAARFAPSRRGGHQRAERVFGDAETEPLPRLGRRYDLQRNPGGFEERALVESEDRQARELIEADRVHGRVL